MTRDKAKQTETPGEVAADDGTSGRAIWRVGGRSLARLIRLVSRTSRAVTDPPDLVERVEALHPSILATWHGQFMMLSHLKRDHLRYAAIAADHRDGELIAQAMASFGLDLVRGSGAGERKRDRGGARALRGMMQALQGVGGRPPASVVLTADVPPGPARRAGEGIITLARLSGRPIVPIGIASSRYYVMRTWSRMTINLPFSKLGYVAGEPVFVPRNATPAELERLRVVVEDRLNDVTMRAYKLAGADPTRATPPNPTSLPRKPGVLLKTYLRAMTAANPLTARFLAHREARGKEDPARLGERRGKADRPRPEGRLIWVHAASVGETNAVLPLIGELRHARPDATILLTTTTVTSARIAAERLPVGAFHQFAPLDVPEYTRAFLDHWRPDLAVFTESEVWPSLILETHSRTIPLALVNGRLSPKSYKRWLRLSSFAEPLFGRFDIILAQTEKIGRWFREVGARNVVPAGNLKADAPAPPVDPAALSAIRTALAERQPLLAASTHPGEEAIVAAAHGLLAAKRPDHVTIIVPRHPERGPGIADSLAAGGGTVALRSRGEAIPDGGGIYVADTLGELGVFYSVCPVVLMGGSLVPHGGQNPLEAIPFGAAILTGPNTHNFRSEYQALLKSEAVTPVTSAAELAAEAERLLADPATRAAMAHRARATLDGLRGALEKTLAALLPLLPPPEAHDHGAEPAIGAGGGVKSERTESLERAS